GSFHEVGPGDRTYNTALVFDRTGTLAATYRKIHLYDVEIPGRASYHESRTVAPGDTPGGVDVEGVLVGLSICYDQRFPVLCRRLAVDGACPLPVPAAFIPHTGRANWEVLLRVRSIDNQSHVAAAEQFGDHDQGRPCYGGSMVFVPWGLVVAL